MINDKEVAVIGLGPAGVSASIYLKRYGLEPIAFEKENIGGKVNKTEVIENYAGLTKIKGFELGMNFENQINSFAIKTIYKEIKSLTLNDDGSFHIEYGNNLNSDFKYVILANGLNDRPFSINNEERYHKRGISRCAICDGPLYKNKDVAIVGAGNSAFEEGLYLASICSHVYLIARREEFRADVTLVEKFKKLDNTTIYAPYEIIDSTGEKSIYEITIKNRKDESSVKLNISGLFLYVGDVPNTDFIKIDDLKRDNGYIIVDYNKETNIKNLYAVGDCTNTTLRQVATAVSDGAKAASSVFNHYQSTH